ncbi:hypothetical protein JXB37_05455, partial [candidate division WOR-3 bacterium]|nr:hypothetical protein [candidate division WOR-3 bacterium]
DILDAYTGLKPVPDQQGRDRVRAIARQLPSDFATPADSYDIKTAAARRAGNKEPDTPSARELRVRRLVASWLRREKLEAWVDEVFAGLGAEGFLAQRIEAREYGRRVWAALARSRPRPGALDRPDPRRKTREQRLEEVDQVFGRRPVELGWDRLHAIRDQVVGLFDRCAATGELDWLPEMNEVRAIRQARLNRRRDRERERRKKPALPEQPLPGVSPEQNAASKRLSVVPADVNRVLEAEGMARERQAYFVRWMGSLRRVAVETRPGTAEREARVAELVNASRYSDDARRVAELYLARADRYAEGLRKKTEEGQKRGT